ncbi:MAG: hypothetical protein MUC74_05790, partial [Ideonella sp.]|nr:hypothetical protein [Ideonella sp.]
MSSPTPSARKRQGFAWVAIVLAAAIGFKLGYDFGFELDGRVLATGRCGGRPPGAMAIRPGAGEDRLTRRQSLLPSGTVDRRTDDRRSAGRRPRFPRSARGAGRLRQLLGLALGVHALVG